MKLEVQANDFCPDNCPYCDPIKIELNTYSKIPEVEYTCNAKFLCEYANMQRKEEENEITSEAE